MIGPPEIAGRFFYRDDMRGFNFTREAASVSALLARLIALAETEQPAPALYAGAAAAADHLPGWADANPLRLPAPHALPRLRIAHPTHVPTHYDGSRNLASVVAWRRRSTRFPPDQIPKPYVSSLAVTMSGKTKNNVELP